MNDARAPSMLLRNARLVLPEQTSESAGLLIENRRIARVLDSASVQSVEADSAVDLYGLTLFPGFIDVHIHGAVGVDTLEATADDLQRVAEFLARHGVTAWLPTLVPAPAEQYERAIRAIGDLIMQTSRSEAASEYRLQSGVAGPPKGPTKVGTLNTCSARVLGVHYEGPFVNSEQCGALHREHFRTFSGPDDLNALPIIENENMVHMMTVGPEVEGGIELISELKRRGWIVSVGHTRATPEVLDQAYAAGAHHMTHFMNAMTSLHHRAPGPVGWGLLNDEVSVDVIADGVHLDPLMLKVLLRCVTPSRMALISDSISAAGLGEGDYEIWGEKISVKAGRTQNARGSIAGSVITMLDAVRVMLSLDASECDVARMASLNPARLLGIENDCGSIEEGKRADLVAIDEQQKICMSFVGGQLAFDTSVEP